MKALIHDEKVVDVKEQSYEVHPSMSWIDCPNDIRIGFFYDGKTFKSDEQTPVSYTHLTLPTSDLV